MAEVESSWHQLAWVEVDERLEELNERLREHGFRSRFRITVDPYGWDVLFDDGGEPVIVDTVEYAERIVDELCG